MPRKTGVPAIALAALLAMGGAACQGSNHQAEGNDGGAGAGVTNSGNDTAVTTKPNDALGGSDQVPMTAAPATQPQNVAVPRTDSAGAAQTTPGGTTPSTPVAEGKQQPGAPVVTKVPHSPAP